MSPRRSQRGHVLSRGVLEAFEVLPNLLRPLSVQHLVLDVVVVVVVVVVVGIEGRKQDFLARA